ncbi:unnamed protein product [Acanthoscelides obtectus]|uniref:Uncharacterized protein n=1 Tax=Acanthoscelides obtectus TaxID=200917 RepID=A0A9P0LU73_ACAOB|nr:unnamed protein product [Acanthoscelides obtectus]CAK1635824.1 hypothetical protein AOBTE_LOCUS9539 [Acanthoscelides obtectus]
MGVDTAVQPLGDTREFHAGHFFRRSKDPSHPILLLFALERVASFIPEGLFAYSHNCTARCRQLENGYTQYVGMIDEAGSGPYGADTGRSN